jgi:hypothetical protein
VLFPLSASFRQLNSSELSGTFVARRTQLEWMVGRCCRTPLNRLASLYSCRTPGRKPRSRRRCRKPASW